LSGIETRRLRDCYFIPVNKYVLANSPELFAEVFHSVPQPVRHLLDAALQLDHLRDLHERARHTSQAPLSRAVLDLLAVDLRLAAWEAERFPSSGPLVVVANHPFGILDGLALDALLFDVRRDIKTLTNSLVARADEIRERCIPIDVFSSATSGTNLGAVRRARKWLGDGHGVAIFPAGEVSHWRPEWRCISDPPWSSLAARFALQAQAIVVPVYFVGSNSLAFQLAGLVHPRMRTVRLPSELFNKRGSTIEVRVGTPISPSELEKQGSVEKATEYLRGRTYMLRHRKSVSGMLRSVTGAAQAPMTSAVAVAGEASAVAGEIGRLDNTGCKVFENSTYAVFAERGENIPVVLREIGRLRELTFRAVGEGTGKALDLDSFDPYYTHLILWHKQERCITGGYRLAWTDDVLPGRGIQGLYTSTLFRFASEFFETVGAAVELGRTFVRLEFQKDYAPLMLLWQAIGRLIASRPHAPILFGPVSISANYSRAAVELMVEYLRRRRLRPDLARLVSPRRPFRPRITSAADIQLVAACLSDIEDLATPLADIEGGSDVPVLLRQYVRLGGRIAAFSVDRNFSNVLDGLLVVDLRETAPKLLSRYMGAEGAATFLRQACGARSA
jgi:putative hemolysin